MFTEEEKNKLFYGLPSLNIFYEPKMNSLPTSAHYKGLHSNATQVYYIIPKGPKSLVWFTRWNEKSVCFLIHLNEKGIYSDISIISHDAPREIVEGCGTIIYGTFFINQRINMFTCEQLYFYKGTSVTDLSYMERLKLLGEMLDNCNINGNVNSMGNIGNIETSRVFIGLPILSNTYEKVESIASDTSIVPYRVYGICNPRNRLCKNNQQHISNNINKGIPNINKGIPNINKGITNTNIKRTPFVKSTMDADLIAVFNIKADTNVDTYHLFTSDDLINSVGNAFINNYRTSVLMNGLFRNVKENRNLDLLEESSDDDDEIFNKSENYSDNVDLNKIIPMECVYIKQFGRWRPNKVVNVQKNIIISSANLKQIKF